ncbi:MAG: NADH:ubiquinone oxidoreductase [Bacteroidales bacterium]|nr:NADH:ubiquinone oxidoreductase [Bacteroidales bacterium]MDD4670791.1 NADH:ubiquinone oxidoreductase [Bacteroidales bacterium]
MIDTFKILFHQGKQYIPDVTKAKVPGIFRGRPVISNEKVDLQALVGICPTGAISEGATTVAGSVGSNCAKSSLPAQTASEGLSIDLGKCLFCGECERCFPRKIHFTQDYKIATNNRNNLIVREGEDTPIHFDDTLRRPEISRLFRHSLKLRQVSAAGDNSCEWELGATGNVNFDMGRFGIEFVASPRHADGIVITGPISKNMSRALQICYDAVPAPKIIVLAGTDAISGGIFSCSVAENDHICADMLNNDVCSGSRELDRSFLETHTVDLFLPGNPAHPLTIINGLLELTRF